MINKTGFDRQVSVATDDSTPSVPLVVTRYLLCYCSKIALNIGPTFIDYKRVMGLPPREVTKVWVQIGITMVGCHNWVCRSMSNESCL
jgi:hypothetical protein